MFSLRSVVPIVVSVMENLSPGMALIFALQVTGANDNILNSKAYCWPNA